MEDDRKWLAQRIGWEPMIDDLQRSASEMGAMITDLEQMVEQELRARMVARGMIEMDGQRIMVTM